MRAETGMYEPFPVTGTRARHVSPGGRIMHALQPFADGTSGTLTCPPGLP